MTDQVAKNMYEATRLQVIENYGVNFFRMSEENQHKLIMKTFMEFMEHLKAQQERQD